MKKRQPQITTAAATREMAMVMDEPPFWPIECRHVDERSPVAKRILRPCVLKRIRELHTKRLAEAHSSLCSALRATLPVWHQLPIRSRCVLDARG